MDDIRQAFIEHFKKHNHRLIETSSLIPEDDQTLFFTAAGMVPFKEYFLTPPRAPFKRVVTAQKCLRAGGKHNDLEQVGYTTRHHTFFEMLGNFSFGDYFKEEAIHMAWAFLHKILGLKQEQLLITVYHTDETARHLWKSLAGFSDGRILSIKTEDNFWSMGDVGPCGPCSEIFYDHGASRQGTPPGAPKEQGDRFVEIWNLVFMEYNRQTDGTLTPLPSPCIDTGMGLERATAIIEGKTDNYETSLFQPLLEKCWEKTRTNTLSASHKVIVDHVRACSFLISDGLHPSNEGRGYVLRRLIRRGMRHAYLLGYEKPLLYSLVQTLAQHLKTPYPELNRQQAFIEAVIKQEEEQFLKNLSQGMKLLSPFLSTSQKILKGDKVFLLYDTYGFPVDLTADILRSHNKTLDYKGFENAMAARRRESQQAAWASTTEGSRVGKKWPLADSLKEQAFPPTQFVGYGKSGLGGKLPPCRGKILGIQPLDKEYHQIVLDKTPCYAEGGGQIGDRGDMWVELNEKRTILFHITDTQKTKEGVFVHTVRRDDVKVSRDTLSTCIGKTAKIIVKEGLRKAISKHHSATHLLHQSLRKVLGEQVQQKGSYIDAEKLRFDIQHQGPIPQEALSEALGEVNRQILRDTPVMVKEMPKEEALETGALALFGEKYGGKVRVIAMGEEEKTLYTGWKGKTPFSVELCGGTHVETTGDIGGVALTKEYGIGTGIRRIEACAGAIAIEHLTDKEKALQDVFEETQEALAGERKKNRRLRLQIAAQALRQQKGNLVRSVMFKGLVLEEISSKEGHTLVKEAVKNLKKERVVIALVVKEEKEKAVVIVGVSGGGGGEGGGASYHKAPEIVAVGVKALGGTGGGGSDTLAQGGGRKAEQAEQALKDMRIFCQGLSPSLRK